jgi:hypothetical protein
MAVEPGLQFVDPLLQLGNSLQRLAQGLLLKQDITWIMPQKKKENSISI